MSALWGARKHVPAFGPQPAKIFILGEAPGETEVRQGRPLIGASGNLLASMLDRVGLNLDDCRLDNVFSIQPIGNDLDEFTISKSGQSEAEAEFGPPSPRFADLARRPCRASRYIHPYFYPELDRLFVEIETSRPNIILAIGNTALWAASGHFGISKRRGTISFGIGVASERKLLSTYHPAAALRDWSMVAIIAMDLVKLKLEAESPQFNQLRRSISFADCGDDLLDFVRGYRTIAVDVETARRQIISIGFARSRTESIVAGLVHSDGTSALGRSTELGVWQAIREICNSPDHELVFQNGLYDIQYLWSAHGIPVRSAAHDTMLMHHAMYPEMLKSLGFLGSIYCNEPSWKELRTRAKTETLKTEDA